MLGNNDESVCFTKGIKFSTQTICLYKLISQMNVMKLRSIWEFFAQITL